MTFRRFDAPHAAILSSPSDNEPSPLERALENQRRDQAEHAKAGPPKGAAFVREQPKVPA
jgi:hypothetical protein